MLVWRKLTAAAGLVIVVALFFGGVVEAFRVPALSCVPVVWFACSISLVIGFALGAVVTTCHASLRGRETYSAEAQRVLAQYAKNPGQVSHLPKGADGRVLVGAAQE